MTSKPGMPLGEQRRRLRLAFAALNNKLDADFSTVRNHDPHSDALNAIREEVAHNLDALAAIEKRLWDEVAP